MEALWALQTTQGTFNHFRFSKVQFTSLLSLSATILTRLASAITSAPTINTTISANHSLINDIFKVLLFSLGVLVPACVQESLRDIHPQRATPKTLDALLIAQQYSALYRITL